MPLPVLQNKKLSDPRSDDILAAQGVGWMKRKAIQLATITLTVKHFKDDKSVENINIDQALTGGISGMVTSDMNTARPTVPGTI